MNTVIQIEIKKALRTKGFLFSILFGILAAVLQVFWFYINVYTVNNEAFWSVLELDYMNDHYGSWFETGILEGWMGCETYSPFNQIFFISFPLLAVLPYGISFYNEWKSGYAGQMIVRCGRRKYLCGKLIAVFFSGGVVVIVPLLLNLFMSACYLPAIGIDPLSMQSIVTNKDMWADLYFDTPIIYALCYTVIDFIYGGIFAIIAMVGSKWFNNRFGILVFPLFIYCMLYYGISNLFPEFSTYNPAFYFNPAQLSGTNHFLIVVLITMAVLFGIIYVYWISNRKRDVID